MHKTLIIAMILVWMNKWNKKVGNITKNILASQADTVITTIIFNSLADLRKYDPVLVLIFDCLKAYLSTWQVYKHGIFQENELLNALLKFKDSSDRVVTHSNRALRELILFSTAEMVENRLQDLLKYIFSIFNKHSDVLQQSEIINDEFSHESHDDEDILVSSALDVLQAIAIRFEDETHNKHIMISEVFDYLNIYKWTSGNYAYKVLSSISSKSKNPENSEEILQNNITQVFIHIYKKSTLSLKLLLILEAKVM